MIRDNVPSAVRGAAALMEMLDCIGSADGGDKTVAKILVDNEIPLRDLAKYALEQIANEN